MIIASIFLKQMVQSIKNISTPAVRILTLSTICVCCDNWLSGWIKIFHLKKITLLLLLSTSILVGYSQSKTPQPKPEYDTVIVGYDRLVILDSTTYNALVNLVGSLPANISKSAGTILNAIDGSNKNVFLKPQYGLKPKNKKQ